MLQGGADSRTTMAGLTTGKKEKFPFCPGYSARGARSHIALSADPSINPLVSRRSLGNRPGAIAPHSLWEPPAINCPPSSGIATHERGIKLTETNGAHRINESGKQRHTHCEGEESAHPKGFLHWLSLMPRRRLFDGRGRRPVPGFAGTLHMLVLVPASVFDRIETDLECKLFLGIPVQVEAEGVKPLIAERVGSGDTGVGVHRHGHDCVSCRAPEEIEVADLDPGILSDGGCVEVVGHG